MIKSLKNCSVRPASLAVRALRYLLQTAEPEYNLGYKIVTHFPSFLVLLKAANDQDDDEIQPQTVNICLELLLIYCSKLIVSLLQRTFSKLNSHLHSG